MRLLLHVRNCTPRLRYHGQLAERCACADAVRAAALFLQLMLHVIIPGTSYSYVEGTRYFGGSSSTSTRCAVGVRASACMHIQDSPSAWGWLELQGASRVDNTKHRRSNDIYWFELRYWFCWCCMLRIPGVRLDDVCSTVRYGRVRFRFLLLCTSHTHLRS